MKKQRNHSMKNNRMGSNHNHLQSRRAFLCCSALATVGGIATLTLASQSLSAFSKTGLQSASGKIWIDVEDVVGDINPNIYGHMAEHVGRLIYDGIWVGEDSPIPNDRGMRQAAIEALRRLNAPVIRWPGGCFADAYHWQDGIGPRERRPKRWSLWWEQHEPNAFGTDEFMRFCRLVGAEPYLSINVGTGDVTEAIRWVEYCNSDKDTEYTRLRAANGRPEPYGVRYWGVGNENWGCGGLFTPDDYAREYLRYALYLKHWMWPSTGLSAVPLELVAAGHTAGDWNQIFLEEVRNWPPLVDHLSIHHYFRKPDQPLATPPGGIPETGDVRFDESEYYWLVSRVADLERHVQQAVDLINYYFGGRKKVGLIVDEWGTWHPQATFETGFYQQNTVRDAIVAGSVLNFFNHRCRDITMANIAQTFNILQAIGLTKGAQMVLTPTFYAMEMYEPHQGAKLVRSRIDTPSYEYGEGLRKASREAVNISSSLGRNRLFLTVVNEHLTRDLEFDIELRGARPRNATGRRLTSQDVRDHNTFDNPERVNPMAFTPSVSGGQVRIQLPAHSVNAIEVELT